MFKKSLPTPLDIVPPSGLFVRTPTGDVYYIKSGGRYSVTEIHLGSWGIDPIAITSTALLSIPSKGMIGFRDGTLCKDFGDGKMYLISDSKKRQIQSPSVFNALGGTKRCLVVPSEYLKIHVEGDPLD
jgi:hypothetical protein